jgi:hypothetical protein
MINVCDDMTVRWCMDMAGFGAAKLVDVLIALDDMMDYC